MQGSGVFSEFEDRTCSLHNILVKESQFQMDFRSDNFEKYDIQLSLKFEGEEKTSQIPEDYAIFFHRNEAIIQ